MAPPALLIEHRDRGDLGGRHLFDRAAQLPTNDSRNWRTAAANVTPSMGGVASVSRGLPHMPQNVASSVSTAAHL
jgi:hypothetical protein